MHSGKGERKRVLLLTILLKKRGIVSTEIHLLPALGFLPMLAPTAGLVALMGSC